MDPLLNLLSKNAIGLCVCDDKGVCIEANQEFCRILDLEIDSILGFPFYKIVPEPLSHQFKKLYEN